MNEKKRTTDDFIDPLNFLELLDVKESPVETRGKKCFFITGTDTGVGKTIAMAALGVLLKDQGWDVGIMKPIQCGGNDAAFLKEVLQVEDPMDLINPYRAQAPLSPHVAFPRQQENIEIEKIRTAFAALREKHDILLVEGAGGLLVPIREDYLMADLIRDLGVETIIIGHLGLGTINHTLLTLRQARAMGIAVKGVILNEGRLPQKGLAEQTNPEAIRTFGQVEVLGVIPRVRLLQAAEFLSSCAKTVDLDKMLGPATVQPAAEPPAGEARPWAEDDKTYLWHPFTQMKDWLAEDPLVIASAKGSYLKDIQGREYLDGVASLWVNVHGHRHPVLDRAVSDQLGRFAHSTLLGLAATPAIALAKKLAQAAPPGLEKVFFSDNGSTAVEVALKMAYQYWQNTGKTGKTQLVHLAHAYHGDTLGSVSVGGIDMFHQIYSKLTFPTIAVDFPDCYRAPQGKGYPGYAFEAVKNLEKLLQASHQEIAALIVEPLVQAAAGMIVWPTGILKKIEQLCRRFNVLLIADEVATGFGRTGKMFACQHENVRPDFLCLAKGLTGGYLPLAATLTTQKIFDGFLFDYKDQKTFFHGHTYTGNALGCAAALANLEVFEEEKTLEALQPKIAHLTKQLENFKRLNHVGQVRQLGFMVGIELVKDKRTKTPFPWEDKVGIRVCQEARNRGAVLRPLGNVIVLMPPLSMTVPELDQLVEITLGAVKFVTEKAERLFHRRRPRRRGGSGRKKEPKESPGHEQG